MLCFSIFLVSEYVKAAITKTARATCIVKAIWCKMYKKICAIYSSLQIKII